MFSHSAVACKQLLRESRRRKPSATYTNEQMHNMAAED